MGRYVTAEFVSDDEDMEEIGAPGSGMGGTSPVAGPGSTTLPGGDEEGMESEAAPPGYEDMVQKLKKDKSVTNPYAVAWAAYNKAQGGKKEGKRYVAQAEAIGVGAALQVVRKQADRHPALNLPGGTQDIPLHSFRDDVARKTSLRKMMVPDKNMGPRSNQVESEALPEHYMSPMLFREYMTRFAEAGTSAGVKKAWITRKGGGKAPEQPEDKDPGLGGPSEPGPKHSVGQELPGITLTGGAPARQPIPASSVFFSTSGYKADHGKGPAGRGRWAFGPKRNTSVDDPDMLWVRGAMFSDALKQARQHFAKKGIPIVHVQS